MVSPTYRKIEEFCYTDRKKWNRDKITVNNDPFPYNMNHLLNWLVEKKIINKWDKGMFNHAIYLRNSLSHLEFAPILLPSARTLEIVAQDINKLYHKQSKPSG